MSKRTALITGASRGIGKACAHALSVAGYRVALAARSMEKLQEVANEMLASGGEAFVLELDLTNRGMIADSVSKATKEFGRIDILVNNAGMTKDGLAVRMKPADWEMV